MIQSKITIFSALLLTAVLILGCAQSNPQPPSSAFVCNKPYIQVGNTCCLDLNNNAICDKDETPAPTTRPIPTRTHPEEKPTIQTHQNPGQDKPDALHSQNTTQQNGKYQQIQNQDSQEPPTPPGGAVLDHPKTDNAGTLPQNGQKSNPGQSPAGQQPSQGAQPGQGPTWPIEPVQTTMGSGKPAGTAYSTHWAMCKAGPQHTGVWTVAGPQTPNLAWKFQYYNPKTDQPGGAPKSFAVDRHATAYFNTNAELYAFNAKHENIWKATGLAGTGSVALSADDSILFVVGGSHVYAYSTQSGARLWDNSDASESIFGELTIGSDGTAYFGSWDKYVYALNPTDGKTKWKYETAGAIAPLASPSLSPDEKTLYVGAGDPNRKADGTVYALDSHTGTLQWKNQLDRIRTSGVVVASDGTLYANAMGRVFHLSAADGSVLGKSDPDVASSLAASLATDGRLYVGNGQKGIVYGLDASGKTQWSFQTAINPDYDANNPKDPPYGIVTSLVLSNNAVYAGSSGHRFYAIKTDGSKLWEFQTDKGIDENCPAISPDGTLYFSSIDGYIYALHD